MSQKSFTSHGHPIPGAPYRPDQRPRNVARCGGPGLCPDCSREAGLGNRKNRMTTIDHQQAVEAVQGAILGINVLTAERALAAATPHLRAAWAEEMAEKIQAKFLGPDFGRNPVNGQDSPDAALHAAYDEGLQTALALLEGGAE